MEHVQLPTLAHGRKGSATDRIVDVTGVQAHSQLSWHPDFAFSSSITHVTLCT